MGKWLAFILISLLLTIQAAVGDTKITQLPLGSAAASSTLSVFPYVDLTDSTTKKLKLSDLVNVPALSAPQFCTAKALTGFVSTPGTVSATDTILTAIDKLAATSTPGAPITIGTYDSQAATANGLVLSSNILYAQSADATHPGMVNTTTQTIAGAKTLSSTPTFSTMTLGSIPFFGTGGLFSQDNNNLFWDAADARLGIGQSGATPTAQLDIHQSGNTIPFFQANNIGSQGGAGGGKIQIMADPGAALLSGSRTGALQFAGSDDASHTLHTGASIVSAATENWSSIAGGASLTIRTTPDGSNSIADAAVFGQDRSLTLPLYGAGVARFSSAGLLSSSELSGDVTTSGSNAATLATVNSNVGSFTYGSFTVNGKGLITAASSGTAPVTSLTVASANGLAGTSSGGATPALTLSTTITGLLKGNGTAISAATSGSDYAPATSGSLPLFGNGSGGFTNGSVTGNTTKVATSTGSLSSGNCAKWDASGNIIDAGAACGTGSGTVTASGTPASGNLTKFSGTTAITNGDLSGDVTTSGTLAATIANLAVTNAKIANSTIDLTAKVTGILPVANGGTGLATLTAHAVYVGNGTSAPTALAVGATNTVLHGNTGADPSYSAIVNSDITNSTIDLTTKVTGVLPSANVGGGRTINAQIGTTYTFVLADASNAGGSPLVTGSNASAQTFTVPPQSSVVWLAGAQIDVCQIGAGKLTLDQGSGVTISSKSSNKSIGAQNVCVSLVRTASDAWLLIGDLIASVLNLLGLNLYA